MYVARTYSNDGSITTNSTTLLIMIPEVDLENM